MPCNEDESRGRGNDDYNRPTMKERRGRRRGGGTPAMAHATPIGNARRWPCYGACNSNRQLARWHGDASEDQIILESCSIKGTNKS